MAAYLFIKTRITNPDQYLPNCVKPGTPSVSGTLTSTTVGTQVRMED